MSAGVWVLRDQAGILSGASALSAVRAASEGRQTMSGVATALHDWDSQHGNDDHLIRDLAALGYTLTLERLETRAPSGVGMALPIPESAWSDLAVILNGRLTFEACVADANAYMAKRFSGALRDGSGVVNTQDVLQLVHRYGQAQSRIGALEYMDGCTDKRMADASKRSGELFKQIAAALGAAEGKNG